MQVSLLLHLPLKGGVPVVFNGVIGPENRQPAASHTCEPVTRSAAVRSTYLPGSSLEMSAQRFPSSRWAWHTMRSSSSVQLLFFTVGFKWLCQRSRHCFPLRVCRCLAMSDQRFMPYFWTSSMTCRKSDITLVSALSGRCEVLSGQYSPGGPPPESKGL